MNLYLYSTNPFFSHFVSEKYLNNKHFVWCSDQYDPEGAPSSSPCEIFISLQKDCDGEDRHSNLINRYRKTFRKLVAIWQTSGFITTEQKNEILTQINSHSWNIWRPQLYIICRSLIEATKRLISVPSKDRASVAEEWKIHDLDSSEFEIIQRVK
jgi:hypothetical protein